ncbi:MAG: glutamate formimidoyltransferase [Planctomycetota bacterium]|jgi:glutamate formiminotransferase/formiminotetrahydrofolate cyclodeaminase
MQRIIECVPNFSEGRDRAVIDQITAQVETVDGVRLLDVDPGAATNRTVVTIAGDPDAVCEAAFRAIAKAAELIDMGTHTGEHPRFGATDVCPLVPVSGITMEETVEYARALARRLGDELGLSIYCYENAATSEERRNLATVRAGEYEGLEARLKDPRWKPDFGPATFNARSGATAVSARDFLVAYNINLNTTSTRRANAIAFDVREQGRVKTVDGTLAGKPVLDANGEKVRVPGTLKCVKGIGWYIEEYGVAQISMNLTNTSVTPVHVAFDEVCKRADARGIRVTGSELVGLVPLQSILDAGRYFLAKQERSAGVSDRELIKIAVKSMGLDELSPFDPDEKIIEYAIADRSKPRLVDLSLQGFVDTTASESPAPGGGSVAAAIGAMGAALGTMVANLSSHKRGWDERWEEFAKWAAKGKACQDELVRLVDADTDAFNAILAAFRLPKGTEAEKQVRAGAIEAANRGAIEIPLRVMEVAVGSLDLIRAMAKDGMQQSASDAGVGALCARTAVMGAGLNVRTNLVGLKDTAAAAAYRERADALVRQANAAEAEILAIAESRF